MTKSTAIEQEILGLEKQYWDAMCDNNINVVMELSDFPSILATKMGTHSFGKEEFRKMFESGQGKIHSYKFDDNSVEIRQVTPETVVVAYQVTSDYESETGRKTVHAADTSTWIKKGGKWVCAMHTEVEIPEGTVKH